MWTQYSMCCQSQCLNCTIMTCLQHQLVCNMAMDFDVCRYISRKATKFWYAAHNVNLELFNSSCQQILPLVFLQWINLYVTPMLKNDKNNDITRRKVNTACSCSHIDSVEHTPEPVIITYNSTILVLHCYYRNNFGWISGNM